MRVLLGRDAEKFVGGRVPRSWQGKLVSEQVCKKIGYPLVVKVISSLLVHKTEKGGVCVVHSWKEAQDAFRSFSRFGKHEVLVQEFVKGVELIAGVKNDVTFGHVVMVGLGGVFVEVFKDVSFRVCPITENDAVQMIGELKSHILLEGVRGMKKVDKKSLVRMLVRLSKLPLKNVQELDINPLIVNEKGAWVVDARVVWR